MSTQKIATQHNMVAKIHVFLNLIVSLSNDVFLDLNINHMNCADMCVTIITGLIAYASNTLVIAHGGHVILTEKNKTGVPATFESF